MRCLLVAFVLPLATLVAQAQLLHAADDYFKRGLGQYNSGNFNEALDDFSQAIKLDEQLASAYYYRGIVLAIKGELKEAILDYDRVIQINPLQATAYYNRGVAHFSLWDLNAAVKDFTSAIEIDPRYATAYYSTRRSYRGFQSRVKDKSAVRGSL